MSLELIIVSHGLLDDALKVIEHCSKQLPIFDKISIHHHKTGLTTKTHTESMVLEIPKLIECDHILCCHWDGFIINPNQWDDSWLQYDWIGAPWPIRNLPNHNWRVGSGGFCLFSHRMAIHWHSICNINENFDWQVGALYRDKFEQLGMKYPSLEVAAKFCKECDLEDIDIPEGSTFGFHGFQYGNGYREKYREMVYN